MDPKYTEAEEAIRRKWKQQAAQAQENLVRLKGEAVAREKLEQEQRLARAKVEEAARKAAAAQRIDAQRLVEAILEEVKRLERIHGVKVTSYDSSSTIHGQQTITVQFTKVAAPRIFTPHW